MRADLRKSPPGYPPATQKRGAEKSKDRRSRIEIAMRPWRGEPHLLNGFRAFRFPSPRTATPPVGLVVKCELYSWMGIRQEIVSRTETNSRKVAIVTPTRARARARDADEIYLESRTSSAARHFRPLDYRVSS
jgi:hypothetical protein